MPPPDVVLGAMADSIPFYLHLAQNASFAAFARAAGVANLRPGWYSILALIEGNPGLTATVLSRVAGKDKSTLTPLLTQLESSGLIVRERAAHDRRLQWVRLTKAGRARLRTLRLHAVRHDRRLDRIVGSASKPAFVDALQRIVRAFERWAAPDRGGALRQKRA